MIDEKSNLNEEEMGNVNSKTSTFLNDEISKIAQEMISSDKDEMRFNVGDSKVTFLLIKKGSEAEKQRESDIAALTGQSFKVGKEIFLLARR